MISPIISISEEFYLRACFVAYIHRMWLLRLRRRSGKREKGAIKALVIHFDDDDDLTRADILFRSSSSKEGDKLKEEKGEEWEEKLSGEIPRIFHHRTEEHKGRTMGALRSSEGRTESRISKEPPYSSLSSSYSL